MKITLLITALFLVLVGCAQTDSLEIKLQQYKKLYDKGLITQAEYDVLKARELQLSVPPKPAATTAQPEPEQLNARSERVNIRVCPVFYNDVAHTFYNPNLYGKGTSSVRNYNLGLNIQVGANIKRRYFPNLSIGFEGSSKRMVVPLGADFNMNITTGKLAPYFHTGVGYMYQQYVINANTAKEYHGMYVDAGFGLAAYVSKKVFITIAPQYRFVFYNEPAYRYNLQNPIEQLAQRYNIRHYMHQLGIKFQVVFI